MAKRCGDLAEFRLKVKSKSVGKTAVTKVLRAKDNNLTASHAETLSKAEDKKIRWPDLADKSGAFYGGRQPDFKGLNKKAYHDKFAQQEFNLELLVDGVSKKSSKGLKINGYADVAAGACSARSRSWPRPSGTGPAAIASGCITGRTAAGRTIVIARSSATPSTSTRARAAARCPCG
jgi:hypothetical protein